MFKIKYTLEYANGGWKYFNNEFDDKEAFRKFVREVKNNPKCIGYVITYPDRGFSKINEKQNGRWIKSVETIC